MATRVRLRYIVMTPLNCLTLKTPCLMQESQLYLFLKPSYSYFCAKAQNLLPWQQVSVRRKFHLRYISVTPLNCLTVKTPCVVEESQLYLCCKPSYSYFLCQSPKFVTVATRVGQT